MPQSITAPDVAASGTVAEAKERPQHENDFRENGGNDMFDIELLMKVMSEILSDMYGCKVTMTATPKNGVAA